MAKRKKLVITREGYLFLAGVGVLLVALIVVAVLTKGFGACSKQEPVTNNEPEASVFYPAPTATPVETPEEIVPADVETPAPDTPDPNATPTPAPTVPLSDDPNALLEPTAQMIAGAAEGKLIKSGVNMRKGPSTKYGLVDSNLKSGLQLTVYAKDGDWYFLRVDKTGKYGYIHEDYVSLDDDDEPTPTKKATSEPAIRLSQGDVNGDGLVSAADAALILRYDAGIIDLSDAPLEAADMDGDDQVTSVDAKTLLRYVANRLAR